MRVFAKKLTTQSSRSTRTRDLCNSVNIHIGILQLDSHLQLCMADLFSTILTERQAFRTLFRHMSSDLLICHQGTTHAREQLTLGRVLGWRRVIRGTHVHDLTSVLRPPAQWPGLRLALRLRRGIWTRRRIREVWGRLFFLKRFLNRISLERLTTRATVTSSAS